MSITQVHDSGTEITIQATFSIKGTMLEVEEAIQEKINEIGLHVTQKKLEKFDTDGSPIIVGNKKFTSMGKHLKVYETLYGAARVERHVYQSNEGGKTFCPLDDRARIIVQSTPLFAKIVSFKYAMNGADSVQEDLEEGHRRHISNRTVKAIGDVVGDFASSKEEEWEYDLPDLKEDISCISIGIDGTCINMHEYGWREAMCGSIAFFNAKRERMHTIYVGAMPEYGKEKFHERMLREINRSKERCKDVTTIGLADGAKDNWSFLEPVTDRQVVDFWHVSEYVGKFANILFPYNTQDAEKESWLANMLHMLKHDDGGVDILLRELKKRHSALKKKKGVSEEKIKEAQAVITYINNQKIRMNYHDQVRDGFPIGSGVTESACKYLIKSRFCNSGSRWKEQGGIAMMSIRSLRITTGRWKDFWKKIDQYGFYSTSN
jgi:hypothetical protein